MKCSLSKLVSPYIDGELSEKDKARFEAHAAGCPVCGARLEAFRGMQAAFAAAEREKAPAWFAARVKARVAGEKPRRSTASSALVRLAGAVVVLLMMTAGVLSGGYLAGSIQGMPAANIAASLSLDVFEAAPADSVGGVYLAMTEANHEK
jgi:anti-sigma factor RsiW